MNIYTNRKRPTRVGEINSGEFLMETAGYISAEKQILNILDAGRRLVNHRKENYDFQPGEKEYDFPIPDRAPNFDMADASRIAQETQDRLENQAKIQKQKDVEKQRSLDAEKVAFEEYKKNLAKPEVTD